MAASCAATGAYTHQLPLPHPHLPSSGMILPSFFFLLFFFFAIWLTTARVHSRSLFLKQLCLVCMFLFALEIHICNMVEFCFCFPLNDRLLLLQWSNHSCYLTSEIVSFWECLCKFGYVKSGIGWVFCCENYTKFLQWTSFGSRGIILLWCLWVLLNLSYHVIICLLYDNLFHIRINGEGFRLGWITFLIPEKYGNTFTMMCCKLLKMLFRIKEPGWRLEYSFFFSDEHVLCSYCLYHGL